VPPVRGDINWGPGYVGWYRTGSHVGWTPLAPGEIFYGRKNYGRQSVNITNSNTNRAAVAYKNRDAKGGLNILLQNDFLRGKSVLQKSSNAAAVSVSVSLGSPRIQPLRETRMPIIKPTPPRMAPSAVRYQDNRELQKRFPRLVPNTGIQRKPQQTPAVIAAPTSQATTIRPSAPPVSRVKEESKLRTVVPQPNVNQPLRKEPSPAPEHSVKHATGIVSPSHGEIHGQENKTNEIKQKKIWKVTTTDQDGEKDPKEHRGKK
jgi:hypothetical protein